MKDHHDQQEEKKKEQKSGRITLRDALKKKEVDEDKKNIELEKGDFLAMVIAFGMYAIPLIIVVILFFLLVSWLFFGL